MNILRSGWLAAGVIGSALLVASVTSMTHYRRDMQAAAERIDGLGSQVIETACGPIEYAVRGQGYPVLVVHGNAGGFDQGLGLAESYLDAGFQVIAPSRFGYLRTPLPPDATPAQQADVYACLLDSLGIERVAILTTSAGATSALQFALRHPERLSGLVLHSPNAPGEVDMALPPQGVLNAIFHSDLAWWLMNTYLRGPTQYFAGVPEGFDLTPALAADVQATLSSVSPISRRGDGMMFDTFIGNPDINRGYPLAQITTPVLVASAVDDPMALYTNARKLAEQIPGAQLLTVPDGGHLMLGHVAEVRAAITAFLRTMR
jgi:pimeloyl-ACP methyl ester carboxylesterase